MFRGDLDELGEWADDPGQVALARHRPGQDPGQLMRRRGRPPRGHGPLRASRPGLLARCRDLAVGCRARGLACRPRRQQVPAPSRRVRERPRTARVGSCDRPAWRRLRCGPPRQTRRAPAGAVPRGARPRVTDRARRLACDCRRVPCACACTSPVSDERTSSAAMRAFFEVSASRRSSPSRS